MNLKLIAAALAFVAAGSAQAAMQGATSGNGELLVNFRYYDGANDTGGNDMSALFDLGITMDYALANFNTAGFTQTWNLKAANYGSAWSDLLAFAANDANIEFNVIALDNTGGDVAGGARYLTTADVASYPALTNGNLSGFDVMNQLVNANQNRGTHGTETNGASTAVSGGDANTYFGSVNGLTDGDTWAGKTTADTTKTLATAQNFWFLTTTAPGGNGAATKAAFGFDLNNNGSIGAGEYGEWSVNLAEGSITYAAPVPEPETYALMLAGLGLVGFMARRRKAV